MRYSLYTGFEFYAVLYVSINNFYIDVFYLNDILLIDQDVFISNDH